MAQGVADDFLASAKAVKTGPPCSTGTMLVTLEPALRAQVEKALAMADDPNDRDYNFVSVSRAVEKHGLGRFHAQTLSRHQRGDCVNCPVRRG